MRIDALISDICIKKGESTLNKFSNHTKSIISDQINSIIYMLKNLIENEKYKPLINDKNVLKANGLISLDTAGKKMKFFGTKFNYDVSINDNIFKVGLENLTNGKQEHSINIDIARGRFSLKGIKNTDNIESFIEDLTDTVDRTLGRLLHSSIQEYPEPYIPSKETSEKLAELNKILSSRNAKGTQNIGTIDEVDWDLVKEIKQGFDKIKRLFKQIPNERYKKSIKSGYNNYISGHLYDQHLIFKNTWSDSETISVFVKTNKNKKCVEFKINEPNNQEKVFYINHNGTVQRNIPYVDINTDTLRKRVKNVPDYYTQQELENINLNLYFQTLNKELKAFSSYIEGRLNKLDEFREAHSNIDVGELENKEFKIQNIYNNFLHYKKKLFKAFPNINARNKFNQQNNIHTEKNKPAIVFKKITNEENDLRLNFPSFPNHGKAMQIIVLDNENIRDSFYVLDNKLLKFKIKNVEDRFKHYDRKLYFHSKDYIEKSDLYEYLDILEKKLEDLNSNVEDVLKNKRRKPKQV